MTEELKPCPFCGSQPKKGYNKIIANWVTCNNEKCGGTVDMKKTMQEAIAAWNTRHGEKK